MRRLLFVLCAGTSLAAVATAAQAGGFQIRENSAAGLGTAFAGAASDVRDLSIIYNNPAAMTELQRSGAEVGVSLITPSSKFSGSGSDAIGRPLSGQLDKTGDSIPVPAAFLAYVPERQNWRVGLAITAPYGLETDYEDGWIGRYHALNSRLETININLAGAIELQPGLSVGGGISAQRAEARLTNAVDFGAVMAGQGVPGFIPQGADGLAVVKGDDWAWGANLGLFYEPVDGTRMGLTWRSEIKHKLEGSGRFEVPTNVRAVLNAVGSQAFQPLGDVRANVSTPQSVDLGLTQEFGAFALHGTVSWTDWSSFEEIRVRFENPAQADVVDEQHWKDTWFYSIGATYQLDPAWQLRTGIAFDKTPTQAQFRTPRIADGDRTWLSAGVGWQASDRLALDVGYTHIFVDDSSIDIATATGNRLTGSFDNKVDIVAVTARYSF